ncbi:protein kinase domain-containing protein [Sorangium sp. So ce426]|uniref:serine/threonine-protein kinase n=1 Tax=Sorangium sp. So ce426 TaxID=3133312 RepID=UPI003F5C15FF
MTRVHPEGFRPEALVGQVLRGKWRLERLLGFGGMAMVYAATHRNGMRGAVKILRRELSEDEEARSRFLREGYVANRVEHPGIVRVLDDDVTDDGSVFLVMELLEGETVEARRAREPGGVLGVNEVLAIADDLLDVLAVAHERGIVHRDLKPDNLFLTRHGQLKVLDFGIARLRELSSPANASTRAGTLMGTPQFMPPEQARGQWDRVDPRSDLWAVGSTMYQLLSGRYVHEAETLPLLLLAAMTQPAPPVGSVLPALPPPIAGVMDVALAFDPDRRWPNARAMQRALRQARGGAALELAPGAPPEHGRAPLHSEHGRGLLHSDPGRPSAHARGPGSGPRGTEFAAAGTASGVAAGGGAASTGTVSPVVERAASAERSAPRAVATGALLAGALAVGALVALVWWQRAGERGAEDPSHGSTVEAEPRSTAGAGATTAPPDSAGSPGAGVQPAPSGDAVPAIAPSAPATTPAPEAAGATAAPAPEAAPATAASASAAAPRPAAGGRARSPATATKAPAAPTPAPAPTPAEDPYNRRR